MISFENQAFFVLLSIKIYISKYFYDVNFLGPAFVPMISQNGAIPPIFVPPGYISQVFEENGVKRVVVLPNVASSVMENRQSELPSPTMHNPAYHHPMFHHPAMPHLQFPMNGFHPHAPPSFIPHQNMAVSKFMHVLRYYLKKSFCSSFLNLFCQKHSDY